MLGLGVVFSIGGGSLTSLLTAPRLTYALSRDGTLPHWFGRVNEQTRVPVNSILFCGAFSIAMALSQQFVWLATLSTFVRLLTYGLCIASLPLIERSVPEEPGQFRLPGGLVIPGGALLLILWLVSQSTIESFGTTICVVVAGSVGYWLCVRRSSSEVSQSQSDSEPRRAEPTADEDRL